MTCATGASNGKAANTDWIPVAAAALPHNLSAATKMSKRGPACSSGSLSRLPAATSTSCS
eukprot:CAMPEP_0115765910 /NCGR_PEP_ID=MMETSP0272-20121206/102843_1 /TAXON_ID=71861 /ORGANISM="Scrippsiella trochoidea, Strain CCMP3099" /LENGTH=59 /DNA_ID=CAMNT_0003211791 /DNA_START=668 /DNA_END=844 /DNA_ORIENTATION=-